jgi:hypothetical protein
MDLHLTSTIDADNPVEWDLHLTDGQITLSPDQVTGIVQHIRQRLEFFRGEWFLDLREGLPYYQEILVKNPAMPRVRALFRATILETPGVVQVDRLDLSLERATRLLTVTWRASLVDGTVIDAAQYGPFILDLDL